MIWKLDLAFEGDPSSGAGSEDLIGLAHGWIQRQRLDEIWIDVADYSHLPAGPGVLLVAHGAIYALRSETGLGLALSTRSREIGDDPYEELQRASSRFSRAAKALYEDLNLPEPRTSTLSIRLNQRLFAIDSPEAGELDRAIRRFTTEVFGELARVEGPLSIDGRPSWSVTAAGAPPLELSLLDRGICSCPSPSTSAAEP